MNKDAKWECPQCGQCKAPPRYNKCPVCGHIIDETFIKRDDTWNHHPSAHMGGKDESPEYVKS